MIERIGVGALVLELLAGAGCSGPAGDTATPTDEVAPVGATDEVDPAPFHYPQAERVAHVDVYHGIEVPDPYRWLEDIDSPQTRAWIEAENELTFGYLGAIETRDAIRQRLTELWNYERWGIPARHGDVYVVSRNDGLQDQSVLYTMASLTDPPRLLLDPNKLSDDGTVSLSGTAFSKDGRHMAYGVSESGSDWETWRVRDVQTGEDLADALSWIKFSGASWTPDGQGFYYAHYDEPKSGAELEELNYNQKLYYHRVGEPQSGDTLVYARPDQKEWGFDGDVTEDGRYLVITVRVGTDPNNSIFVQDLRSRKRTTLEVLPGFTAKFEYVGNDGPTFWFLTDDDAPRQRLVAIDIRKPTKNNWKELIGQTDETLRSVSLVGERLFAVYLADAHSRVDVYTQTGKRERELQLPGLGSAAGFSGERDHSETFYAFSGFATPGTVYRYDIAAGTSEVFREPTVAFDPDRFVTKQVYFRSMDGTRIPMFVTHLEDLVIDGNTPTYLYGYGGFNIPITPQFSVPNVVWMELGGIYAVANLRGGGEYGRAWHQSGTKLHKQNVFDDFIAAAQYLIAEDYTKPSKLVIGGRSNGGLLVGAVMTQRPDLFGVALPGVGVMDMLRFNRFTIGWAWQSDYGSPDDPNEFTALRAYSPYHNLETGTRYPATLVYTADHDDRVVPAHSYKFAAALQHAHRGDNPVLIRVDTKSGHGAGKPVSKQIEEWTDLWGFAAQNVGMDASGVAQ